VGKLNAFEAFAVNHYLSEFPEGKTFEEILELVEEGDDEVIIWQPFENYHPKDVAQYIRDLCVSLAQEFMPKADANE